MANKDPKRNPSGCLDLTAYEAIKNIEKEEKDEYERCSKVSRMIFDLCELAGFSVIGRINLKDKRTGKNVTLRR